MSFGKEDTQETKQTTEPWKPTQGALKDIVAAGGNLFGSSNNMLQGRMAEGNPLYDSASGTLGSLISGDTLDVTKSPMWGSMVGGIQDAVNSQFSLAGRTGSPAHAGVMTGELGKLAGQLWNQERGRQLQGIGMAPSVYEFGNAGINDLWENLARYGSLASGIGGMGGTQNSETTTPDDTLGQILGIAAGAAGLASRNPAAAGTMGSSLAGLFG